MKLTPLNDWAVIIPAEEGNRTAGGLYIPDTAKEEPQIGLVEAIGPGAYEEERDWKKKKDKKERKFVPTVVKPGDYVLFAKYAAEKFTIDNKDRYLVREKDIFGILLEKPAPVRGADASSTEPRKDETRSLGPSSSEEGRAPKSSATGETLSARKAGEKKKTTGKAKKASAKKTAAKTKAKAKARSKAKAKAGKK